MYMAGAGGLVLERGERGVDLSTFDQLAHKDGVIATEMAGTKWREIASLMRERHIERLMPASENGVRGAAVRGLAELGGFRTWPIPGSKELSWVAYSAMEPKQPDLVEYQTMVAESKHWRVRRMNNPKKMLLGITSLDGIERRTVVVAFDTVIWHWNGGRYVPREKPETRLEALRTITELVSGEPFFVSTVCVTHWLDNWHKKGVTATLLPVKVQTRDRWERVDLIAKWLELYDSIASGMGGKWKITPAGPSLMHPLIQPHIVVGLTGNLADNVLPENFSVYDWVYSQKLEHTPMWTRVGDEAYRNFGEKIVARGGYVPMGVMSEHLREQVGMVFSGCSVVGMRLALELMLSNSVQAFSPARASHANEWMERALEMG